MTGAPSPAFETLQRAVGEWSEENFGDQPIVNPLLGVGEEFGELCEQVESHDEVAEHELDCVGDMLVYLADFCYRRGLDLQAAFDGDSAEDVNYECSLAGVSAALGALNRSVLKQRQGIRLDDDRVGDKAERQAVALLLFHLAEYAVDRGYSLEACIRVAWDEEVADREWDSSYTA